MSLEQQGKGGIFISNQTVIFNIRYTPYALKKGATAEEVERHREERAFYDMSGGKNVYEYINTERKRTGNVQDYFEKNHGVFNGKGFLSPVEIEEMKKRAQTGEKNLWHGFISIDQKNSHKIAHPEQAMKLVRENFGPFLREMGLDPKNVDLMCALHLDRKTHYHIHFAFWEKEPQFKYRKKELEYRHKGRVEQKAIDRMKVRLSLYIDMENDYYSTRDEALRKLRSMTAIIKPEFYDSDIRKDIEYLCEKIPRGTPMEYGRKEMEPYRFIIDDIVTKLFQRDREACEADERVVRKMMAIDRKIQEYCEVSSTDGKTHFKVDPKTISRVDELKTDYKRRTGNIVLKAIASMRGPYRVRHSKLKYKVNDKGRKRSIAIADRMMDKSFLGLVGSFASNMFDLERDFSHRLQDIEEEIEERRKLEEARAHEELARKSKYNWSK